MNIESFFGSLKDANEAVAQLKKAGINKAYVDMNEHYVDERNIQTNLPGTETSPSLSALVLESDDHVVDRSKAPLTAASPMVSGMGTYEEIANYNCRVMVDTDEASGGKAREIIKNAGGTLQNPNIDIPRGLENVDLI